MRGMVCLGIVAALLAAWSTSAVAAPVDTASEHVAVRAFDRYLRGRLTDIPAGRRADHVFVAAISAKCPDVLAHASVLVKPSVARAFSDEVVSDLAIEVDAVSRGRIARMTKVLSKLPWSSTVARDTVKRLLDAQHRLFSLAPSDLCADANALAANPQATPAGTLQLVATDDRDSRATTSANSAFLRMLARFADVSDAPVFKDILEQLNRLKSAYTTVIRDEVSKLFTAIGISP